MPSKFEKAVLALLPPGYSVSNASGKGHSRLIAPDGEPVRRPDGMPLTLPNSPGCRRSLVIMRSRLRACGLLQ